MFLKPALPIPAGPNMNGEYVISPTPKAPKGVVSPPPVLLPFPCQSMY